MSDKPKSTHGGKRAGSGRKPSPSVVKRIPVPLVSAVEALIATYDKPRLKTGVLPPPNAITIQPDPPHLQIPRMLEKVPAGFPSPATDYHEDALDWVTTVLEFVNLDLHTVQNYFNVMVERTWQEMREIPCANLEIDEPKKQIICSRSFGKEISDIIPLKAAIAHHISNGATKLRKQGAQAHLLSVFICTNAFKITTISW